MHSYASGKIILKSVNAAREVFCTFLARIQWKIDFQLVFVWHHCWSKSVSLDADITWHQEVRYGGWTSEVSKWMAYGYCQTPERGK
jgi:hypothetical protein